MENQPELNGKYTPFFMGGLIIFLYPVARGWESFKFLGDLLFWRFGGHNFFFWEMGARPSSSIKLSMTNHVNTRIVDGKIIFFMYVC